MFQVVDRHAYVSFLCLNAAVRDLTFSSELVGIQSIFLVIWVSKDWVVMTKHVTLDWDLVLALISHYFGNRAPIKSVRLGNYVLLLRSWFLSRIIIVSFLRDLRLYDLFTDNIVIVARRLGCQNQTFIVCLTRGLALTIIELLDGGGVIAEKAPKALNWELCEVGLALILVSRRGYWLLLHLKSLLISGWQVMSSVRKLLLLLFLCNWFTDQGQVLIVVLSESAHHLPPGYWVTNVIS